MISNKRRLQTDPDTAVKIVNRNLAENPDTLMDSFSMGVDSERYDSSRLWQRFLESGWPERDELITHCVDNWKLKDGPKNPINMFLMAYKSEINDVFLESFYNIVDDDKEIAKYAKQYATIGEINMPLLNLSCLSKIADWAEEKEMNGNGNNRYGTTRYVYPPGEAQRFEETDPRKALRSQVNLCAIGGQRHMFKDDIVQWIYHSPHLQKFIKGVMDFKGIYPYNSDIGVAVNVNRPFDEFQKQRKGGGDQNDMKKQKVEWEQKGEKAPQTALGFHFDSIDSSIKESLSSTINQARGATGVIGIQDCTIGGERITFPTISRLQVSHVKTVLDTFNPLQPSATLIGDDGASLTPNVVKDPIAGVLSVFNGGDILHAVSSVREGLRVATVFLYAEQKPTMDATTKDNCEAFYGAK